MVFRSFDEDYVGRLASGDPVVENHFTIYFGELLFFKLRGRIRSPELLEDARQETLLRVLQVVRRKGGVEHPERFGAFVNGVCNNVACEVLRGEARYETLDETANDAADDSIDLDESIDLPLVNARRKRLVASVLAELPPKDRDLLRAFFLKETERAQICRRYGVTEDYLRVLLHRAKLRFRESYLKKTNAVT